MVRELSELPVYPRKSWHAFDPATWRLRVEGLVANLLELSFAQVQELPSVENTSPFECLGGWRVPRNQWRGVAVATLLEKAKPLPEARFVTFHTGDFVMSLKLEEARLPGVLLAYSLNGAPLPLEHGAPLRLVAPGKECYYGLKWVERIELTTEARETGKAIALARLKKPKSS